MDLVLLVCLASAPGQCHEERILMSYSRIESRNCMAAAVPTLAEWAGDNPGWDIQRWKCGASRQASLEPGQ